MITYFIIGSVWAIFNAILFTVAAGLGEDSVFDTIVNDVPFACLICMFVLMVLLWPVFVVTNAISFITK